MLRRILSALSPNTADQIDVATAAVMMATLTSVVSAVQALAQTSAGQCAARCSVIHSFV